MRRAGLACTRCGCLVTRGILDEEDVSAALDDVRAVLAELGIGPEDLTAYPLVRTPVSLRHVGAVSRGSGRVGVGSVRQRSQ